MKILLCGENFHELQHQHLRLDTPTQNYGKNLLLTVATTINPPLLKDSCYTQFRTKRPQYRAVLRKCVYIGSPQAHSQLYNVEAFSIVHTHNITHTLATEG